MIIHITIVMDTKFASVFVPVEIVFNVPKNGAVL